jgi:hypothetical protein
MNQYKRGNDEPEACISPPGALCTETGCWDADRCVVLVPSRDRNLWFRENSAAQAALGRVRELADEWEHSGRPRIGAGEAAKELRAAIKGGHPQ